MVNVGFGIDMKYSFLKFFDLFIVVMRLNIICIFNVCIDCEYKICLFFDYI